jgi:hypothetical protein
MRTALKALAVGMGLSLACPVLAHNRTDLHMDAIISASGGTPQSAPILTFENLMNGASGVMATITGMRGNEFLNALGFNFAGSGTPTFNHIAGPQAQVSFGADNAQTVGPVGQGGAGFDVLFDFSNPNAQNAQFDGSDVVSVWTITGAGVDQNDFNVRNDSGLLAAAHIGGFGTNGSALVGVGANGSAGGGGDFVAAPIPEAEVYAMLLAGLGLLGFVMRRRRRSVVPAI